MTPQMDATTVTYHKGHLMPGFKQTSSQAKFVNLGLRVFSRIDSEMARQAIRMIGKPISEQLAFFRSGSVNSPMLGENFMTEANIRKSNPVDFESNEGGSPLTNYSEMSRKEAMNHMIVHSDIEYHKLLDNKELADDINSSIVLASIESNSSLLFNVSAKNIIDLRIS